MTSLSSTAQLVMVAATNGNFNVVNDPVYRQCIAAALRAAIDQPYSVPADVRGDDYWCYRQGVEAERERLQAIANELLGWDIS